jgi:hypothetical protein
MPSPKKQSPLSQQNHQHCSTNTSGIQALSNHIKVGRGDANQQLYKWAINERQLYKKYHHAYTPCITNERTVVSIQLK